jgi:hypothetical protein
MDNHFYNILGIFKKLDEQAQTTEGSMAAAAKHGSGPEFTSYWKGTDKGTPGNKIVGSCEESIEQECDTNISPLEAKLRAKWKAHKEGLAEYGMTTGGTIAPAGGTGTTATAPAANPAANAAKTAATQQSINKLKSAGVNIPSVSQAVKSTLKNPATDPATTQDRQVAGGLGQEVQQMIAQGDPNSINQLATLIKKTNTQAGVQ